MIDYGGAKRIVWIASFPRSGNTWIRAFLYSIYNVFRDPNFETIDFSKMSSFGVWDYSMSIYRKYLKGPPELIDRRVIASLRPRVMREVVANAQGAVLVKTHNARIVDGTPFIEPALTAGAIYVIRNPLDVAISFAAFRGKSIDHAIEEMATKNFGQQTNRLGVYWISDSWSGNVKSWAERPEKTTLVVRYEDLLDNPHQTFGQIAAHLGMRPTDDQLSKAIGISSFDQLRDREQSAGFSEKPTTAKDFFRSGKAGEWRETLTGEQARRIISVHRKQMERFGYLP